MLAQRLATAWPDTNRGWTVRLLPLQDFLRRGPTRLLSVLFGAVVFVLLIACANVASLLLARSVVRSQEVAVRSAVGASRWRLLRQLLAESLLLSVAGGAAGLLLARWGVDVLAASLPAGLLSPNALRMDAAVLAFTLAVSVGTGLLFGVLPALRLSHADPASILREGGRSAAVGASSTRMQSMLTIGEIAVAVTLLVGAGVLLAGLSRLQAVDPGFRADHVLTAEVSVRSAGARTPETRAAFFQRAVDAIAAQPGVDAASAVTWPPMTSDTVRPFDIAGRAGEQPLGAGYRVATEHYAQVMGMRVRRGRFLAATDTAAALPVAVINETMARRAWGAREAVGERLAVRGGPGAAPRWMTVVGVMADVRHLGPGQDPEPEVFVPLAQDPPESVYLAVRTAGAPAAFAPTLRATLRQLDPDLPLSLVRPMEQVVADFLGTGRFTGTLLGGFALLALLLSSMGLFGVVSYVVNQRAHEFGVRLALGATGGDLLKLVLRRALLLTGTGTVVGLAGGLAVSRLLRAGLMGDIRPEPGVFLGVTAALVGVALLASVVPLRRVLRADPLHTLRA
jgi:putative ABC transport system permease protein